MFFNRKIKTEKEIAASLQLLRLNASNERMIEEVSLLRKKVNLLEQKIAQPEDVKITEEVPVVPCPCVPDSDQYDFLYEKKRRIDDLGNKLVEALELYYRASETLRLMDHTNDYLDHAAELAAHKELEYARYLLKQLKTKQKGTE